MTADSDPHHAPLGTQRGHRSPATESSTSCFTDRRDPRLWGCRVSGSRAGGEQGGAPPSRGRHPRERPRPCQRIGIPCGSRGTGLFVRPRTCRVLSGFCGTRRRRAARRRRRSPQRIRWDGRGRSKSGDALGRVGGVVRLRSQPHRISFVYRSG